MNETTFRKKKCIARKNVIIKYCVYKREHLPVYKLTCYKFIKIILCEQGVNLCPHY